MKMKNKVIVSVKHYRSLLKELLEAKQQMYIERSNAGRIEVVEKAKRLEFEEKYNILKDKYDSLEQVLANYQEVTKDET